MLRSIIIGLNYIFLSVVRMALWGKKHALTINDMDKMVSSMGYS